MTQAGPRILVVDDNDDNRYTLTLYLDLEGYGNVATAQDGEDAIARLKTDSFDLVLLDVQMPKIDGPQVLAWAREQTHLRDVPVIMISALNEIGSVVRCIELGAVDYLLKPFNPVLLKARLGATLEKKRLRDEVNRHLSRLEIELDAARRLQLGMLPRSFPPPTRDSPVELFARMEPAREVGGDLYDFFRLDDGSLCFLLGDVSGKGMPAALFMARTKSVIRLATELMHVASDGPVDPAAIVARVNRELCQDNDNLMFVTLFFAILAPATGELRFCNAGHNPPYWLDGREPRPIKDPAGMILGVRPDAVYRSGTLALAPHDGIFVYSDGVTEAGNPGGELFSEQRLEAALRGCGDASSAGIVASIAEAVTAFVGAAEPSDDVAMMALRRVDPAAR